MHILTVCLSMHMLSLAYLSAHNRSGSVPS